MDKLPSLPHIPNRRHPMFIGIRGLATKNPVVKGASLGSLALNAYAIFAFVWWPIIATLVLDFGLKSLFGDAGNSG